MVTNQQPGHEKHQDDRSAAQRVVEGPPWSDHGLIEPLMSIGVTLRSVTCVCRRRPELARAPYSHPRSMRRPGDQAKMSRTQPRTVSDIPPSSRSETVTDRSMALATSVTSG
jgi:hypothetical protein